MDGRNARKEGRKQKKTNEHRVVSVHLHSPAQPVVIGGSNVIIRWSEGGLPDLVLALVEQKVGSVGLKAETDRLTDWSNSDWVYVLLFDPFPATDRQKEKWQVVPSPAIIAHS